MSGQWSQRVDVREALKLLSDDVPLLTADGRDPRWPSLTEAVHWLIDDTDWDMSDPDEAIGRILTSSEEAAAVRNLVQAVMRVHDRHGPTASDAAWYGDQEWPRVRELAAVAVTLFDADEANTTPGAF